MNLIDVSKTFQSDDDCLDFIEQMRWPKGIRCVTCGGKKVSRADRIAVSKNKRSRFYTCLEPTCKQQFTPTAGTIFHDSHLPLTKWFLAVALMIDAKKGISAKQLERHLQINYRTAWYMAHRIRKAMIEDDGKLFGTVEVDETYVGGKQRGQGRGRSTGNKEVVIGMRQRGGNLKLVHTKDAKSNTIYKVVNENVDAEKADAIMTDDFVAYQFGLGPALQKKHHAINHSKGNYVMGDVHTNTIENAFSLFKRGIVGNFHQVSIKHLHRYLSEFEFRFNRREAADRFEQTLRRMTQIAPMQYKQLVADATS